MRARNGRGTAEYSQSPSVSGLPAAALTSTSTVMATAAEILEAARECCQIYGDAEGVNGVAGGPACVLSGDAWWLAGDRRAGESVAPDALIQFWNLRDLRLCIGPERRVGAACGCYMLNCKQM
jgi:hypothetical protein